MRLRAKEKHKTKLNDIKYLSETNNRRKITSKEVSENFDSKLIKKYILNEGRIVGNRFTHIPIDEYRFVVDLPGYWMETDRKQPRKTRTATHTSRNYQY